MSDIQGEFNLSADAQAHIKSCSPKEKQKIIRSINIKYSGANETLGDEQRAKISAVHGAILDSTMNRSVLRVLAASPHLSEEHQLRFIQYSKPDKGALLELVQNSNLTKKSDDLLAVAPIEEVREAREAYAGYSPQDKTFLKLGASLAEALGEATFGVSDSENAWRKGADETLDILGL